MEEEACLETRSNRSLEDAHFHLSIPPVVSFLEESEEGEKCRFPLGIPSYTDSRS